MSDRNAICEESRVALHLESSEVGFLLVLTYHLLSCPSCLMKARLPPSSQLDTYHTSVNGASSILS